MSNYERAKLYVQILCRHSSYFETLYLKKSDDEKLKYLVDLEKMLFEINPIALEEILIQALKWRKSGDSLPTVAQILITYRNRKKACLEKREIPLHQKEKWAHELRAAMSEFMQTTKGSKESKDAWVRYLAIQQKQNREELGV